MCGLWRYLLLVVVWVGVAAGEDQPRAPPVVKTRQGAVRGRYQISRSGRQIFAFYNLPYAKPPVGELRFRDPQPPEEWPHIRDATAPGSDCVQYDDFFFGAGLFGSEDCLYLNVFTPQLSESNLLPVMFWVHGGGFFYGGAKSYGPDFLLDHDVVLVTINYRLGPFGFLSTEDEAAPGNYGMKDQVAALRWVHDNIALFGGDPGRVTVFGESAGGASVHMLALSPLTKGLLHRVIAQSGTAFSNWARNSEGVAAENTQKIAELVGCPTDTSADMVDCLRKVDDHELLDSLDSLKKWYGHPVVTTHPVIDDESEEPFLPNEPLKIKPETSIQWMIGVCENEGGIMTAGMYQNKELMSDFENEFDRVFAITGIFDNAPNKDEITEKIRQFYMPSGSISLKQMTDLYSDMFFYWNADEAVRQYKNSSSVFYYLLSYKGKYRAADPYFKMDFDFGAGHTDDLFYLFPRNPFYPTNYNLPKEDMEVVQTVTKLWTNFARTGNPTPGSQAINWPKVTSDDEPEYMDIGRKLSAKKGLAQERIKFWRSLPFRKEAEDESLKDEL